jgi:hypothetical protein
MPGLDHPVHEKTRVGDDFRYGCHNRGKYAAGYFAPDGYTPAYAGATQMHVQMRFVPHVLSTDCRFDLSQTDPACRDCKHRGKGAEYNELLRTKGT